MWEFALSSLPPHSLPHSCLPSLTMSTQPSQLCHSARTNTTTAPDHESEPDSAPLPVKSPKPKKGCKRFQSSADEVASKRKKKDDNDNDTDTDNEDIDNTTGGDELSGEQGRVARGRGRGGKAAPLRGKGGKRAGKGKTRYVINIRCLLPPGMSPADSELIFFSLFPRKTHAERAVEDEAEDAKGIPKKLTP